jgi:predicted amidophosphoribosyltransferase
MKLTGLECENCGASELERGEDQRLVCSFCGSWFGQVTRICPECGHYSEEGARRCSRCGSRIVRDCPTCGWDNWALATHCVQCGRDLELVERMVHRWQHSTRQRMEERRAGINELKDLEERASAERMSVLMEAERVRQEALALSRASQQERDRQVYMLLAAAAVVFVVLVVVVLVLGAVGG